MKKVKALFLIWLFLCSFSLFSLDYYMSPGGNDLSPGTAASPLASLEGVFSSIKPIIAAGLTENLTVHIQGGDYFLSSPLIFDSTLSGNNGCQVIFRSWNGTPRFLGGKFFSSWTQVSLSLYRVYTGGADVNALFYRGQPGTAKSSRGQLTGEMDWYYDGTDLYFYPPSGDFDPDALLIPLSGGIFSLGAGVENLEFRNLILSTSLGPGTLHIDAGSHILITGCEILNSRGSGILITGASEDIRIENSRVDGFLEGGIVIAGVDATAGSWTASELHGCGAHVVENCHITRGYGEGSLSGGIYLFQARDCVIRGNELSVLKRNGITVTGITSNIIPGGNTIEGNRIHHLSSSSWSRGIFLSNSPGNRVTGNVIYALTSRGSCEGILMNSGARGGVVTGNLLYGIETSSQVFVPFYLNAPGCVFRNNISAVDHINGGFRFAPGSSNSDIRYNIICSVSNNVLHLLETSRPFFSYFNNNWYNSGNNRYLVSWPPNLLTFQEWQGAAGVESQSVTNVDFSFVEPGSGDFRIPSGELTRFRGFSNLSIRNSGLTSDFPLIYARDRLEGEKAIVRRNMILRETTTVVSSSGSYLGFPDVNCTGDLNFAVLTYANSDPAEMDGGNGIEIRLSGPGGRVVASGILPGTGGFFETISFPLYEREWKEDLYLLVTGSVSPEIKIDYLSFSPVSSATVKVVNKSPEVRIIQPLDGQKIYENQEALIQLDSYDPDGSIRRLSLFIDGEEIYYSLSSSFSYSWTAIGRGTHVITAIAEDDEGFSSTADVTIEVFNDPDFVPVVNLSSPRTNSRYSAPAQINVSGTASSPLSPVTSVEFYANDRLLLKTDRGPYSFIWGGIEPGEYVIFMKALNQDGIYGVSSVRIYVDSSSYLVGYWPLDEVSGDQTYDVSPNGNHGTVLQTGFAYGFKNGALDFRNDGVVYTGKSLMNNWTEFTMAGWIKPRSFGTTLNGFFGQDRVAEVGFNGTRVIFVYTKKAGGFTEVYHFPLDEWHHVAVTGNRGRVRLYLDGQKAGEALVNNDPDYGAASSSFNIGSGVFSTYAQSLDGGIDEVYLYSKAIAEWEIKDLARVNSNILPEVSITSPFPDSRFEGPLSIPLRADARDKDTGINVVEFYANGEFIGSDTEAPYEFIWENVYPGSWQVEARAIDLEGGQGVDRIYFTVVFPGDDLLAYWSFDNATEVFVYDESNNNNHCQVVLAEPVEGIKGMGFKFSQTGFLSSSSGMISNLGAFSMAGWIKPEKTGSRIGLWGQDGVVEFGFITSTQIQVWTQKGGAVTVSYPFSLDEWHHIAVTGDGMNLIVYFDGVQAGSSSRPAVSYGASPWTFNIGGRVFDTTGNSYQGVIDEVYVFGKALSPGEVQALFKDPFVSGPLTSPTPEPTSSPGVVIDPETGLSLESGYSSPGDEDRDESGKSPEQRTGGHSRPGDLSLSNAKTKDEGGPERKPDFFSGEGDRKIEDRNRDFGEVSSNRHELLQEKPPPEMLTGEGAGPGGETAVGSFVTGRDSYVPGHKGSQVKTGRVDQLEKSRDLASGGRGLVFPALLIFLFFLGSLLFLKFRQKEK